METQILAFDDITRMIDETRALAVVNCTCRMLHGDCGKPVEVCIQTDKAADYTLDRGTGREITKDEALEILRLCEIEGLVHTVSNTRSGGNIICNCCDDCCVNWPGAIKQETKFAAPSRFTASIAADQCTGCEACTDRCYFDAIAMDEEKEKALINGENCMGCGLCVMACEFGAIALEETSRSSLFENIDVTGCTDFFKLLWPYGDCNLAQVSSAQQIHECTSLTDTTTDGQRDLIFQDHLVIGHFKEVFLSGFLELLHQSLLGYTDTHGCEFVTAFCHWIPYQDVTVEAVH